MGSHLVDGRFQSDKYPTTPAGKVPLSVDDPTAQDLLWLYAERRRSVDAEFSDDLETALKAAGYSPPATGDEISALAKRIVREGGAPATVATSFLCEALVRMRLLETRPVVNAKVVVMLDGIDQATREHAERWKKGP